MEIIKIKDPIYDEIVETRKRLSELKAESLALQEHVEEVVEGIVAEHFKELSDEINALEDEIEIEQVKRNMKPIDLEQQPQKRDPTNKELKEIFHTIARFTHPDKVGDRFVKEFQQAVEAYDVGDIDTLEEILSIVDPNSNQMYNNRTAEEAEKVIERLKNSIIEEEIRLQKIRASQNSKIAELYESGDKINEIKARHILSDFLFKVIVDRTAKLNELKKTDTV